MYFLVFNFRKRYRVNLMFPFHDVSLYIVVLFFIIMNKLCYVLCDLVLNRCTATWNLFVLYNKETNYTKSWVFLF